MKTLESLVFDNGFAALPETFHSRVNATPVPAPYLVTYSPAALKLLELDVDQMTRAEWIDTLAGNRLLPGMDPVAALYAGHQFGHFVPQLGDGRAILLGEVKTSDGSGWEVQIKGGGRKDKVTWFASYGPYEQPRYVVIVMVESGASGGGTCAPVARRIYQFLHQRATTDAAGRPVAVARGGNP